MNAEGIILNINEGFHLRFGHTVEDLKDKYFAVLFTEEDKLKGKPETELHNVLTKGCANDENYLCNKAGARIWVTGESVLIENENDEKYIVKIVHNIHAQKQLERFLMESHEFIDTIFDSIDESALLLLDSRLRIIKANKIFSEMFDIKQPVKEGSRLSDLDTPFWQRTEVKQQAINYLVMQNINAEKNFDFQTATGEIKILSFHGKLIEGTLEDERKLLLMIKYV